MPKSTSFCPHTAMLALAFAAFSAAPAAAQTTVTLDAEADATIYEDFFGDTGNGGGEFLHVGRDAGGGIKRILLRFDLSGIPAGSTIDDATLTLYNSRTQASTFPADLHRLTNDWTEGPSNPLGNEGSPSQAEPGDVNWIFRSYEPGGTGPQWDTWGGDFVPTPSASTPVGGQDQYYHWNSAGLTADIQAWLDGSADNNGWIMIGTETGSAARTSKRFDSRTNPIEAQRPALSITYTEGNTCLADIAEPFGVLDLADVQAFIAAFTGSLPAADVAEPFGVWDLADLQAFVASFNAGCP